MGGRLQQLQSQHRVEAGARAMAAACPPAASYSILRQGGFLPMLNEGEKPYLLIK